MSGREKKAQIIDELQRIFSECSIGVLTDYRGISAAEMIELRRKLRESAIEFRVVKDTLARFAAEKLGKKDLADSFEGPVAVACGYGDVVEPPRVLTEYIRATKSAMSIKGGFMGDQMLTVRDVETLSSLPSKEVLLSQVLAGIQSPIYGLVNVLAAPIRGIMGVLQARMKQLEVG